MLADPIIRLAGSMEFPPLALSTPHTIHATLPSSIAGARGPHYNPGDQNMITFAFTYETVTPESAEHGDYADHGFTVDGNRFSLCDDEVAHDILHENPDAYRIKWQVGTLEEVIERARNYGICEASDSYIGTGTWFSSVDPDCNYTLGEDTTYALHVEGATRATMKRIHALLNEHSGLDCFGNAPPRLQQFVSHASVTILLAESIAGSKLCGFRKFDLLCEAFPALSNSDVRIVLSVLNRSRF